jgi:hypothetical protein
VHTLADLYPLCTLHYLTDTLHLPADVAERVHVAYVRWRCVYDQSMLSSLESDRQLSQGSIPFASLDVAAAGGRCVLLVCSDSKTRSQPPPPPQRGASIISIASSTGDAAVHTTPANGFRYAKHTIRHTYQLPPTGSQRRKQDLGAHVDDDDK